MVKMVNFMLHVFYHNKKVCLLSEADLPCPTYLDSPPHSIPCIPMSISRNSYPLTHHLFTYLPCRLNVSSTRMWDKDYRLFGSWLYPQPLEHPGT